MTDLKCSVYDCAYHSGNCCCKPDIRVNGLDACGCGETQCASYAPRGNENAIEYSEPNEKLDITCSAKECMYNQNMNCNAHNVSINKMNGEAGCRTFVKR